MKRLVALAAFIAACASNAYALTSAEWRVFLEESYSPYASPGMPTDMEDELFQAGRGKSRDAALAAFAARAHLSPETAAAYADVIVAAVNHRKHCESHDCTFELGDSYYQRVAPTSLSEPTGALLTVVGKNEDSTNLTAFVALVARHSAAQTIYRDLYEYNADAQYLGALLLSPLGESSARTLARGTELYVRGDDGSSGWIEALLEHAENANANAAPAVRAGLAQLALQRKLKFGLNAEALAAFDAYPANVRALLPLPPSDCTRDARGCDTLQKAGYDLTDDLAAALWLANRKDEARAMLHPRLAGFAERDFEAQQRFEALSESMTPQHGDADLFGLFIQQENDQRQVPRESGYGAPGWLFRLAGAAPAVKQVVAARLAPAGYAGMAHYLERLAFPRRDTRGGSVLANLPLIQTPDIVRQRAYWEQMIAAARSHGQQVQSSTAPLRVAAATPAHPWSEQALPASIRAWHETDEAPSAPTTAPLPVDPQAVIRYEARVGERYIVYQSSDYDLPGEVPAFGLWFARTDHGVWSRPLYLGLQQYFPYVVTPSSALPLVDGGRLQIEVQVREINPDSITFPPVGTSLRRSADGLYISMDLSDLAADSDGDHLTDIEESRLGLDPHRADTDGDGVADGEDPLPLTARDARAAPSPLARAILTQILGHEAAALIVAPHEGASSLDEVMTAVGHPPTGMHTRTATVFLIADPSLFTGVATPFRLMIYSGADEDEIVRRRGGAPFYAPGVIDMFSSLDGRTHYITWSAKWTGGAFVARCANADTCEVEEVSRWIT